MGGINQGLAVVVYKKVSVVILQTKVTELVSTIRAASTRLAQKFYSLGVDCVQVDFYCTAGRKVLKALQ